MLHPVLEGDRRVDKADRQVLSEPEARQGDQLVLRQGPGGEGDHVDPMPAAHAVDPLPRGQVRETPVGAPVDDGVDELR